MQPGKVQITMEEYLALDALSSGICHTLVSRSPAHAYYEKTHPHASSSAMDLGTVVHRILLEHSEERIEIVDAPDWKTKAARQARDSARLAGRVPMLAEDMPEIREMVEVARAYIASSEMAEAFDHGQPEETIVWQEEGGFYCKARPDWLSDDLHTLVHFKTVGQSADPETFTRTLVDMGYDVAEAFYARGMQQALGIPPQTLRSVFLAQETRPPYACALIGLAPSMQELATIKVEYAINVWGECVANQCWPAYPTQICYAEAKPWQITQAAEAALRRSDYEAYERILEIKGGVS